MDASHSESERGYESERSARRYGAFYTVFVLLTLVGFLVFSMVYLSSQQPDFLKPMLTGVALIGTALGGGYGLKAHVDAKKRG